MKKVIFVLFTILILIGCEKGKEVEPNIEKITVTLNSSSIEIYNGAKVIFSAVTSEPVKEMSFYFNGELLKTQIQEPYRIEFTPENINAGSYTVKCIATSNKNNPFSDEIVVNVKLRLGDEFGGGKIFKLNSDGKSGLIASTKDLEYDSNTGFFWGEQKLMNTSKSDGKSNTSKMASIALSSNYAGYHFKDGYVYNGYNDWYIPAIDELTLLKENKEYVGGFSNKTNWEGNYWSSSEISQTNAEALHFNALMGNSYNKQDYSLKIRPIRKF